MFFENDILSFHILDVIGIKQKNVKSFNLGAARNFNAVSYRFKADAYLGTDANQYHITDNTVSYVPARLNYTRTSAVDEMIVIHFETVDCQTDEIEFFTPKSPEPIANMFKKILLCWEEKETGYKYKCSSILYDIFAECYKENFKPKTCLSKIENSVNYIAANYKNPKLSISEIAKQSYMSEVHFRRLFKDEYGISPQKHIIKLRIQNAAGLISAGYYSLKEVAAMSGYNDYKYFSVEFKKIMGVSPSQYVYNFKK